MLYFAYGSNLNIEQMKRRCPAATPLGAIVIDNFALVFRGVADIEPRDGSLLHGGLWEITDECVKALDRYEGVSSGLYLKRYFPYQGQDVLFYTMSSLHNEPPYPHYAETIRAGFGDFGLPVKALDEAIKESYVKYADEVHEKMNRRRKGKRKAA